MPKGKIIVITGPIRGGKKRTVEELLSHYKEDEVYVFTPPVSTCSSEITVGKHIYLDESLPTKVVTMVLNPADEIEMLAGTHLPQRKVICFLDAHFFGPNIVKIAVKLRKKGYLVIISCVDLTVFGEPFGHSGSLMAVADQVTKVTGTCAICGEKGSESYRNDDSEEVIITDKDKYICVCHECKEKLELDKITKVLGRN